MTKAKGHEPMLSEVPCIIAGPLFKFTYVKMKGPNKQIIPLTIQNFSSMANEGNYKGVIA